MPWRELEHDWWFLGLRLLVVGQKRRDSSWACLRKRRHARSAGSHLFHMILRFPSVLVLSGMGDRILALDRAATSHALDFTPNVLLLL